MTTLFAGLVPALQLAKQSGRIGTGSARASASRAVRRFREMLVTAEIAVALVLLIGTGLMIRTFLVLRPASPGFEVRDRVVATITLPSMPERDDVARGDFARRLIEATSSAAPGARVALTTAVPMSGLIINIPVIELDGRPYVAAERRRDNVDLVIATPNYSEVIDMQLLRGRGLVGTDAPGSVPVIVLNESAAKRFWPDIDPIGRRITLDLDERRTEFAVVGVAADMRSGGGSTTSRTTALASFWQIPWDRFELVVHQPRDGGMNEDTIRRIVASIDPTVPVGSVTTLEEIVADSVAGPRYHMVLMTAFGALGVILALVGCYGVLS